MAKDLGLFNQASSVLVAICLALAAPASSLAHDTRPVERPLLVVNEGTHSIGVTIRDEDGEPIARLRIVAGQQKFLADENGEKLLVSGRCSISTSEERKLIRLAADVEDGVWVVRYGVDHTHTH